MDLERLSVRLRPRTGWESVDLGLALTRTWWRPVYAVWLTLAVPLAILPIWLWGGRGLLLFWWLLPLCESAVLFTLSRAVFGTVPSFKEALRAVPGLWRRSAFELLFRRLRPTRVLYLPLAQLEGVRGKERRQRAAALAAGQDVSGLLAITFVIFELGLWTAVVVLAMIMTPGWIGIDWELIFEQFFDGTLGRSGYFVFSMTLAATLLALHPLYVGAGFAIYLNRRTELEGWDLEIAFRRLARRMRRLGFEAPEVEEPGAETTKPEEPEPGGSGPVGAGALASILVLALASSAWTVSGQVPEPAGATDAAPAATVEQDAPPGVWTGDPERDPRELIEDIMARPELQRHERVVRWRLRKDLFAERSPDVSSSSGPSPILLWVVSFLSVVTEPLFWLTAAVALALLLRAAWRRLPEGLPDADRKPLPPERLFGLDLRPESLPDDVPGEAEALWQAGRHAAALSLLYRGALGRLAAGGLELRASFTEDDCLRVARADLEPRRLDFFTDLTRAWQRVAYAHRVPEVSRAQLLWSGWAEHFEEAR